jgi:glycosyltransferase involved in cell wall biosynthesis
MNQKKVSVIIPTYNRASFISGTVQSILDQEYHNLEILIVDDGSTDSTKEIVNSLQQKYSNILYYENSRVNGPSGARNTGLLRASGDYLAFLDSDDKWLEGHLSLAVQTLEENQNIDVLFGDFKIYNHSGNRYICNFFDQKKVIHLLKKEFINSQMVLLKDNIFIGLIQENFFHLGSTVIRKVSLGDILFDENVKFAEDRDFAIKLYKEKKAIFSCRLKPAFIMYEHDSNLTRQGDLSTDQELFTAHQYLFCKYLKKYELTDDEVFLLKNRISKTGLSLAYNYRHRKKFWLAFKSIVESSKYEISLNQFKEFVKLLYACSIGRLHLKFLQTFLCHKIEIL